MPPILSIRDGMKAQFHLKIHNVLHCIVLCTGELLLLCGALVDLFASFEQLLGAQEGSKVFRAKGRVAV